DGSRIGPVDQYSAVRPLRPGHDDVADPVAVHVPRRDADAGTAEDKGGELAGLGMAADVEDRDPRRGTRGTDDDPASVSRDAQPPIEERERLELPGLAPILSSEDADSCLDADAGAND